MTEENENQIVEANAKADKEIEAGEDQKKVRGFTSNQGTVG